MKWYCLYHVKWDGVFTLKWDHVEHNKWQLFNQFLKQDYFGGIFFLGTLDVIVFLCLFNFHGPQS